MPLAATWMDLEIIILIRQSQSDRQRQISYDLSHMWNLILKMIQLGLPWWCSG